MPTFRYSLAVLVTFFSLAAAPSAFGAAQSDLDPSFGNAGVVNLGATALNDDDPIPVAAQGDGKLVIANREASGIVVRRLTVDGGVDAGFGVGGSRLLAAAGGSTPLVERVLVSGDGTIYIYGSVVIAGMRRTIFWALDEIGTPKASFNAVGYAVSSASGTDGNLAGDAAFLPDGSIVSVEEVQSAGNSNFRTRFISTTGVYSNELGITILGFSSEPTAVAVTGPNSYLISLRLDNAGAISSRTLGMTVAPNNLDGTFGSGMFSVFGTEPGDPSRIARAFSANGTLAVVGDFGRAFAFQRTGVDGKHTAPNYSFQRTVHPAYPFAEVVDGGFGGSGHVVAAGTLLVANAVAPSTAGVARFNPDGSPDATFGQSGVAPIASPATVASGYVTQPSGKYVVVGVTESDNAVYLARLWGDGAQPAPPTPPVAKFASSLKSKLKTSKAKTIKGTATGTGLTKIEVAIQRVDSKLLKKSKRCRYVKSTSTSLKSIKAVKGKCVPGVWIKASGTASWSLKLKKKLPAGKYVFSVRGVGATGTGAIAKKSVTLTT